ncbi:MAG: bacillithiol system redox-active protein YtxJ [Rhodothermales bacterium]
MSFFRDMGRFLSQEQEQGENTPASPVALHGLKDEDQLAKAFEMSDSEPVVIFKHSVTCPISSMARRRILHLNDNEDPEVFELVVQSARGLSQKLEQDLGIRHESPQVIILHKQTPIYDASHHLISVDEIRAVITEATEAE